jgi:hypothetical protein
MTDALISGNMPPGLMKVVERAQREPEGRFHSLAHLIDVPAFMRAYHRIRKDGDFGVSGNFRCLLLVHEAVRRAWFKWIRRRSQRTRLTWERYIELLKRFPLPTPRIRVQIWGA